MVVFSGKNRNIFFRKKYILPPLGTEHWINLFLGGCGPGDPIHLEPIFVTLANKGKKT